MRRLISILAVLMLSIFLSQCSNQITDPQDVSSLEDVQIEIDEAAQSIVNLDEISLEDSTQIPRSLERALIHLDKLLDRAQAIVDTASNTTADSLMGEAFAAQALALEAVEQDSLRLAFSFVRESRHLALEAVRAVKGEAGPPHYIEHLWADMDIVLRLKERVKTLLEDNQAPIARRLYNRGTIHIRHAKEALEKRQPRRAHFHLHTAREFLNRALFRLQ
ncbi:hypothetical protein KAR48_01595 [bacterium]|nr:hypothetical protein [bacterium]